jgi:hypothetical protein
MYSSFPVKIMCYTMQDFHSYKGILGISLCWSLSDPEVVVILVF